MSIKLQHIWVGERLEDAIYLGDGTSLVRSGDDPNKFYVTTLKQCDADCKSFKYRGTCRHIEVAREAEESAKAEAKLIDMPLVEVWPDATS